MGLTFGQVNQSETGPKHLLKHRTGLTFDQDANCDAQDRNTYCINHIEGFEKTDAYATKWNAYA